jgi:dihydrolipoamide dehydrogenase
MVTETFDLVVIGGGTGGLRLALRAANAGLKTAIVDSNNKLGGTCLNTGCIPTKALLHAAELYRDFSEAGKFGIEVSGVRANFKKIMGRMRAIVLEGQVHINKSIKTRGLTLVHERAAFVNAKTLQAGKRLLRAKKFVIATGAHPVVPNITGLNSLSAGQAMVSDDILTLNSLPSSLAIIGGGYIALEFATFFAALGTKVTILEHGPRILKELDSDFTALIETRYKKQGICFLTNCSILEVTETNKNVSVICAQKGKSHVVNASHLLVATGRAPNTSGLCLEKAGVKINEHGGIIVNDMLETTTQDIYAFGDVIGRAPFAHAAKRESYIVVENILHETGMRMPFDTVPWAVFTNPVIAGIGMSEEKAQVAGVSYNVQKAAFRRAGRATIIGQTEGFVKLVYERKSRKLLGACCVGPRADDIIHEFVAFLSMHATIDDVHAAIHIHPTLSEVVEALQDSEPLPLQQATRTTSVRKKH